MIKTVGQDLPDGYVSRALLDKLFPEWMDRASCIGQWDLFDNDLEQVMGLADIPLGMSPALAAGIAERDLNAEKAVKVCWQCPVRGECLRDALAQELEYTIRGGYTPREREVIKEGYSKDDWQQF